jgi:hypothetical protein
LIRNGTSDGALRACNKEGCMSDEHKEVVVEKTGVNVGGVIAAIALLIAVLAVVHYFGIF